MCSGGGAVRVTLYRLLGPSPLTRRGETPFGRSSTLKTCLPVHSSTGLRMHGGGSSTCSGLGLGLGSELGLGLGLGLA